MAHRRTNVEIGTEAPIFLFWEYLFRNFGILSLQCAHAKKNSSLGFYLIKVQFAIWERVCVACFIISDIICNLPPFIKILFQQHFFANYHGQLSFIANLAAYCWYCSGYESVRFFLHAVFNPANPDPLAILCILQISRLLGSIIPWFSVFSSIIPWYPILSDSIIPLHPCYPAVSSPWYPCYKTILYYPLVSMLSGSIILWYPCCVAVL